MELTPATWYNLRISAHNNAGSSVAEYECATLTLTGGRLIYAVFNLFLHCYFAKFSKWKQSSKLFNFKEQREEVIVNHISLLATSHSGIFIRTLHKHKQFRHDYMTYSSGLCRMQSCPSLLYFSTKKKRSVNILLNCFWYILPFK